jgi:hypothetical protein
MRGIANQFTTIFKRDLRYARAVADDGVRRGLNGIF